ncbi:IGSF1 protein, partial [Chauna torquata]|nr:IGSF1 protein [Chauna torquata]
MRKIGGFRFFNQTGDQVYERAPYSHTVAWLQLTATKASGMEYTCVYWVQDSGQQIHSNRSLPLSIKVQDAPMAPVLSLDPQQPVYRYGNNVKLLCNAPLPSFYIREFQYYADFGLAISIPVWKVENYSYNLKITGGEVSGSYSCAYFVFQSGRVVRSESSLWVNVYVKSQPISWIREIVIGGSFFTINGLIFFFSHHLKKKR